MTVATKPLGGPLDPIDWAVRYGERRAEREAEEREHPALICERIGTCLAMVGDGVCINCGRDVW